MIVAPTKWLDYNHPAANTVCQDALKIRVSAVDDHPFLREGIAALIADETDIEQFRTLRPDVTRMDLQMPILNRAKFSDARIVVHMHTAADCGA